MLVYVVTASTMYGMNDIKFPCECPVPVFGHLQTVDTGVLCGCEMVAVRHIMSSVTSRMSKKCHLEPVERVTRWFCSTL